ncbi:MAG: hypothetical protein ACOC8F_02120 [Planctomycetota bacterium]
MNHTSVHAVLALVAVVTAAAMGGCVNVSIPERIQVDTGGSGGGNDGGESGPDQLPGASTNGSWKDAAYAVGGHMLGAQRGVLFYAFDTLAYPGKPVDVAARLQSARNLKGIEGATMGFYLHDRLLAEARTDADGYGRFSWTPPEPGDYAMRVRVLSVPDAADEELTELPPAPLLVAATPKQTELCVIDLDHTVVDSGFFRVLIGGARPMRGAADVVARLARRYQVVYLTHRPNILTAKSKQWLTDHDFPSAPVLVSELRDVLDSGEFKTGKLKAMRASYPNVRVGIGDKLSDAQAYVDNGMVAVLVPHYDPEDADEMDALARDIRDLNGRGRLHVVGDWGEIERVFFGDAAYPPERFARYLEARARRRRAEQRREDDDDDD